MSYPTLKRGANNDPQSVRDWQAVVGVPVDGKFGPATESATKIWQRAHRLVPDGVVGPVSWSVAKGDSVPRVKTAQQPVDSWAYDVSLRAMPELTAAERQYALTVARGEGFYGQGWGNVSEAQKAVASRFGLTGLEGVGSNNWGAEQGTGDAGSFRHIDYHADGSPYVGVYRRYSSPEKGFAGFARVLFGGGLRGDAGARALRDALAKGDLDRAVREQAQNGYFELAPVKYLAAVKRNYDVLTANLDWTDLFGPKAQPA